MGKASKAKQTTRADSSATQVLVNLRYAVALHQQGHLAQAKVIYRDVLKLQPHNPDALHLLGTIAIKENEFQRAHDLIAQAIAFNSQHPIFQYNYGIVLYELGRFEESIVSYNQAIATQPQYAVLYLNRGNSQQKLKQFEAAVISYDQAIMLQPAYAEAYSARGVALKELRQYDAALSSCRKAIQFNPRLADAYSNLGNVLLRFKRYDEALVYYEHAIELKSNFPDAYFNRGVVLALLTKLDAALASYAKAIALNSDYVRAHFNMGKVFFAKRQSELAMQCFEHLLAIDVVVVRDVDYGHSLRLHAKLLLCDWTDIEQEFTTVLNQLNQNTTARVSMPFELLSMPSTSAQQKRCAEIFIDDDSVVDELDFIAPTKTEGEKIRIGYFSSDFRAHPVGQLSIALFESHDRHRFDVYGFGLMPTDTSAIGDRFIKAFDQLIDLSSMKTAQAIDVVRALQLDIAINLNGHTENNRNELFDHRIAPIQVNYLGYAGTMGATFMDYIVGDHVLIPSDQENFYTEKIVRLPHSFFPSSHASSREKSTFIVPTRHEQQLPEDGFVFACFNNCYKITPDLFDVWMRLLKQVDGSVLWLSKQSSTAVRNLMKEAQKRGVLPSRLIFAQRVDSHQQHVARLGLADLFLDTRYYNAHTTAADALWAGLPVLTYPGESFASRVAASLLSAVGLNEMIAPSMQAYEDMALALARDSVKLNEIKAKLAANRQNQPLFDIRLTTRHLEKAYEQMHERRINGLMPETFHVATLT